MLKKKKKNCGICQGLRTGRSAANSLDLTVEMTRNCLIIIIGFLRQKSKLLADSSNMALSLAHMHAAATGSERERDKATPNCYGVHLFKRSLRWLLKKIRDSIRRSRVAYTLLGRLQALT